MRSTTRLKSRFQSSLSSIVGKLTINSSLVFRWIAIPWLQDEIDKWVLTRNRTAPRADNKKILPHGPPELIRSKPEHYGAVDFKVMNEFN